MSWGEVEDGRHCRYGDARPESDARQPCPAAIRQRRRDDLRAGLRVWLLTCFVSLLLMLEDDVAMMAFMFC